MSVNSQVMIVTATLNFARGWKTVDAAAECAGMDCLGFTSVDEKRDGGTKTANHGLRMGFESRAPFICYLNDDVSITQRGWLYRMVSVLLENPDIGVAGITGRCRTMPQCRGTKGMAPAVTTVSHLSYFCVLIRRTVLEKIGYLDERFIHYGCDNDYSIRVRLAGWRVVWIEDLWADHTLGPVIKHWKEHDSPLFKRIWPSGGPIDQNLERRLRHQRKGQLYRP